MNPPDDLASVAIIGMSGRFPGARNLGEFWANLSGGVESITHFSDDELLAAGVEPGLLKNPAYVRAGAVLDDVAGFDADFFGLTPREAEIMDPQHRIFLECAWEALEDAGCNPAAGSARIGVFASAGASQYFLSNLWPALRPDQPTASLQYWLANDKDYLAARVAYALNLRGPSLSVQTACSSSLIGVCLACQSLLNYQCDVALAGGVRIAVPHRTGYLYEPGLILSPDGRCRAFDARAAGTVAGSGCGVVTLKRLADARADGDCIYAVIRGSAINNDGSTKAGFTAPSPAGQSEVILAALAAAGVPTESIGYVEAHGTGTALGDPIEVAALTRAFRQSTSRCGFCALGSVKTNFGHLIEAAGIAGLIKTALALHHRALPPSLHFEQPNPNIDFARSPFFVNTTRREWTSDNTPRRAGVSSFGLGGTNAHVVLEEAPAPAPVNRGEPPWVVLPLSAKSPAALRELGRRYRDFLSRAPETPLAEVCFSAAVGRRHFEHRRALLADSRKEMLRLLGEFLERPTAPSSAPADGLGRGEWTRLAEAYERGEGVDWVKAYAGLNLRKARLPTYAFQRRRFWIEPSAARAQPMASVSNNETREPPGEQVSAPRHVPAKVKAALRGRIEELAASSELRRYRELLDRLEGLIPGFVAHTLGQMGCVLAPGRSFTTSALGSELQITERHGRCFQRWLEILAEDGLLRTRGGGWEVLQPAPALRPLRELARLRDEFPVAEAELRLLRRCVERWAEVLRGTFEPLELLFPAGQFDAATEIYQQAPHARWLNGLVRDAVLSALAHLPREAPVRILELGAGTGGTTACLLPHLRDRPLEYVFTDLGRFFVDRAQRRLRAWPFVRCAVLDIEREPECQGFAPQSCELIIAANVLHATRDLRQTLRHTRQLLKPGGALILLEITSPLRLEDVTSGLIEGWWRFEDFDLRPAGPLLGAARWEEVLREVGFEEVVTLAPEDEASRRLFTQSVLVAQNGRGGGPAHAGATAASASLARRDQEAPALLALDEPSAPAPDFGLRQSSGALASCSAPVPKRPRTAALQDAGAQTQAQGVSARPPLEEGPTHDVSRHTPAHAEAGQASSPTPHRGEVSSASDANGVFESVRESAAAVLGLHAADVPVDRPLSELGLDSLMAVELRHRVSRACGVELEMLKTSEATCVATLAVAVARCRADSAPSGAAPWLQASPTLPACLLPLQSEGQRLPFFCVHPVAGSPMCYLELAAALGQDRPFYGFQAPGLMDAEPPLRDIDALAQRYVEALRAVQPRGPYLLGGWSFGALVAWEMARRLEEANERVAVLALFDAGITTALLEGRHARLPSLLAGARVILKNLYYLKLPTSYAQVRWLGQAVGISLPRSCREVWRRDLSSQSRFWRTIGRGILSSLRVSVNNFIAIRNYRPGAFHGEVTLFRATNSTRRRDTLIEGLTKLAPERLTVRHVPGNHMAIILDRAHVRGLAEELRSCLNRAGVDDPATTKDAHSERRAAEATIEASQLVK